jgi:8-oxo-dGTP pyrophosphatase MutT (NUDIX family)
MQSYGPHQVRTQWVQSTRPKIPELEARIEQAWREANQRPGVRLFDSPMCRLESFDADRELLLSFSLTSYKIFVGTHYFDPSSAEQFGKNSRANAIGISAVVQSADGFFLLGRRNATVAHYAGRVHTFAGALEPPEAGDVFAAMRRELDEELHLTGEQISEITLLGLVEDASLHQPELVFDVVVNLKRQEIAARLDGAEHSALVAVESEPKRLRDAVTQASLTPVAAAALLLCGRRRQGAAWFDDAAGAVNLPSR